MGLIPFLSPISIVQQSRRTKEPIIMSEQMTLKGTLKGHNGWVTQIATTPVFPDMLLSASRDKTIIMWHLTREDTQYGIPKRRLQGHSHFVSDVVISSDGQFCLSGSWDGTLRLWDLASGNTTRRFIGHTKDVLSVAFSADNRQIVSLPVIAPSNCGTLWVFASTPSKNKVTPNGFPVFDSPHWPKTQLLFHLVGINWSRSGISPTANSSVITTATLAT